MMKLNLTIRHIASSFLTISFWVNKAVLSMVAIALIWQSVFMSSSIALPIDSIATMNMKQSVEQKADKDADRTKDFVQDTKTAVQKTAQKNAKRVEQATNGKGNLLEERAKKDAVRINVRAEQDAARTQDAIDDTKTAIERTVEGIKDAFN
jgi:alpha-beta hydrolase superfamily lysophospholipase